MIPPVKSAHNANPTHGSLEIALSGADLSARFVGASGGTFSDVFVIGAGNGQSNIAPRAAFTVSCQLRDCSFDASGSADSDGTISGYAWNFGDGTTGQGVAPTHSYAADGNYTVTLTVTDDIAATASTSQVATATSAPTPPPPPASALVADDFERTVAVGWGSAVTGGVWTTPASVPYSVSGGMGRISAAAGAGRNSQLNQVSSTTIVVSSTFGTDKAPTGSGLYYSLTPRRVAGVGGYVAKVRILSNGQVTLEPVRVNASASGDVSLQTGIVVAGLAYTVGDRLAVKAQVSGTYPTTIRAKVWKVGTAEPVDWQRSVTDATAGLQVAGGVALNVYLSGSATNSPIRVSVDDVTGTAP